MVFKLNPVVLEVLGPALYPFLPDLRAKEKQVGGAAY